MNVVLTVVEIVLSFVLIIIVGLPLYALPAVISLPTGRRSGIEPCTLDEAAESLRASKVEGWDLVEMARRLVEERMAYCRRNSFDPCGKAFDRGYGYCQQQAYALQSLLRQVGIHADVVHAYRNRFPNGKVGGHAWVRVTLENESRDIDSIHYDMEQRKIDFQTLTSVKRYSSFFRVFAGWGSAAVNAHRYYRTGKEQE